MSGGCPTVHEHDAFKTSYSENPSPKLVKLKDKLERFLKTSSFSSFGEYLKHDLAGFKSHPPKNDDTKIVFILCKDFKADLLKKRCGFCQEEGKHTMNDAVLFYAITDHDKDYKKAAKIAANLKVSS